jgi:ACS family hexuronate transporter-like MFS transporter
MRIHIPGFRWFIVGLLFFGTALSFFDRQVLSVLSAEVCRDLHMDNAEYARVVSAFLLSYTIMFAVGGRLLDWMGTRLGMLLSVLIWSIASGAHALVRTPFEMAAARFCLGLGEGACFPGVTKAALEWFPLRERSRAIGFAIGGAAIGAVLAPPLTVGLVAHTGWRGAFLATGAIGAMWVVAWALFYRRPHASPFVSARELAVITVDRSLRERVDVSRSETPTIDREKTDVSRSETPTMEQMLPLGRLLTLRPVWGLILARLLLDPVFYLYMFWIPQYLSQARSATLSDIGALAWVPFLTLDVANMLGGWVSDRLVRAGWSPRSARKTVMGVAATLTPISILAMFVDRMDVAILLMSVLMFAHGFWITNYITLTGELVPQRSVGTVVGLCGSAGGISGYLTTRLIGAIVDRFSFVPVFVVAGVMYPIGFLVILLTVPYTRPAEEKPT